MIVLRKHQTDVKILIEQIVKDYYLKHGVLVKRKLFISAFPGGGKSILPIIIFKILKQAGIVDKLCWVVPRKSLRRQAAEEFGKLPFREFLNHSLEVREIDGAGDAVDPSRENNGFVTTYQAITSIDKITRERKLKNPYQEEFKKHKYLLFIDEIHHLTNTPKSKESKETDYNWYLAVKPLAESCNFLVGVSGTPFRHEESERIAFIEYSQTENGLKPIFDISYDYGDASIDKAVIPIYFEPLELLDVSYTKIRGKEIEEIKRDKFKTGTDLGVALSTEYGNQILSAGLDNWEAYRLEEEPRSKCIIVCANQKQCRETAKVLEARNTKYALAISDEPNAHPNIERFKKDKDCNVLITCQMAYEGLDCIQATHLICLSLIRSLPFLIQMFTRVMRYDRHSDMPYESQKAFAFVPTDDDMNKALEFVHATKDRYVKEKDDISSLFGDLDNFEDKPTCPTILENQKSQGGRFGQQNSEGIILGPELRTKIKIWQVREKIKQTEIESFNFLKKYGLLNVLDDVKTSDEIIQATRSDAIIPTPKEREKSIREKIQKLASRSDYHFGVEKGTWNKKTLNKFKKVRKEMTESELHSVYEWLKEEIIKESAHKVKRNGGN